MIEAGSDLMAFQHGVLIAGAIWFFICGFVTSKRRTWLTAALAGFMVLGLIYVVVAPTQSAMDVFP
ncbi:hypothetical protein AA0472_2150 [Acetobacter estunensis NRIC 0472]|uniref:Uncharacterized protein n=1 Tax=Acetobacter estunensis TaxID=104097 RepID=A0A967EE66_9PROT|nr:hypothetical protein [Acetobacter estunensis]NHO55026.1 hypothetical protein [Acetobacter estunensis]GBQ26558.1 hypothetical protein AA0472_2150 [Acetobacter estunensis NRIC 0472]